MNGAHDMGGMHGFGPINPEPDEPVFHAEWEKRVFALTVATGFGGEWNIDMVRFARESTDPAIYLRSTYYEKWLLGLQRLLIERGQLSEDEIAQRMARIAAEQAAGGQR
jgi:nitrile hydratase